MTAECTVTLKFSSVENATSFLSQFKTDLRPSGANIVTVGVVQQPPSTGASSGGEPIPASATIEDVRKAFSDYIAKGGGRTAATGKAILEKHGLDAIKNARPDQLAGLLHDFQTQ